MELSIDTSTRYASVALSREGKPISEHIWRSERNHSVELVPAIMAMAGRAGVKIADLRAIFIARGPGAFSALRVGMSTAKTIAAALGKPLISIATLDIEAQPYVGAGLAVCAVIEAGRNRLYVGSYPPVKESDGPKYQVMDYEELATRLDDSTLLCGEGAGAMAEYMRQRRGATARIVDVPPPTRAAGLLAYLGYRRWRSGETDDPATLQPLYLRSSQVEAAQRTLAGG